MQTILVTCPPMLGLFDEFAEDFAAVGLNAVPAETTQILSEEQLIEQVPSFDGWIIGDDPATRRVLTAGVGGRLKAAVKWGVGVDNVDFDACRDLGLPITNTPGVFGREVADVATAYVLDLARQLSFIDREIRHANTWPKLSGISLWNKKAGIVGFGDIGRQTARRLKALGLELIVFDPGYVPQQDIAAEVRDWTSDPLDDLDFIVFTVPLNVATRGMFSEKTLGRLKHGVRIVNVARGAVIQESALIEGLRTGIVRSAALDVFEVEPLSANSPLRDYPECIFGSHNGSNTVDAVRHVSRTAIGLIRRLLPEV